MGKPSCRRLSGVAPHAGFSLPAAIIAAALHAAAMHAAAPLAAAPFGAAGFSAAASAQTPAPQTRGAPPATPDSVARKVFPLPDAVTEEGDRGLPRAPQGPLAGVPGEGLPARWPGLPELGPSEYRPRGGLPFVVSLPPPSQVRQVRALLRVGATEGPGGGVAFALRPRSSKERLLWGAARGWSERVPGRTHRELDFGARWAAAPSAPVSRGGAQTWVSLESWDAGSSSAHPGESRLLAAGGFVERLVDANAVLTGRVAGGRSECRYDASAGQDAALEIARRSWLTLVAGVESLRPVLDPAAYDAVLPPEASLRLGLIHHDSARGGSATAARWRGFFLWRRATGALIVAAGLAGGGQGGRKAHHVLGPHLALHWRSVERRRQVELEVAPRMSFVDEWVPAVEVEDAETGADREAFVAELRRATLFDASLPPERAWPRAALDLSASRPSGRWRISAEIAHRSGLPDWGVQGGASPLVYVTTAAAARWMAALSLAMQRPLQRGVELRLRYQWQKQVSSAGGAEPLRLRPTQAGRATLSLRVARWFAEFSAAGRSRVRAWPRGASAPAYLTCGARLGVRCLWGELALSAENLFSESLAYRPDDVLTGRWFGLEWQRLFHDSPP